jgi:hypothetical protein
MFHKINLLYNYLFMKTRAGKDEVLADLFDMQKVEGFINLVRESVSRDSGAI